MAVSGITAGQRQWLEQLIGNDKALDAADVKLGPQTNEGIVWVNGFGDQDNGRFKYQTIKIGAQQFLLVSGQIKYTQTVKAWTRIQVLKWPTGVGIGNAHMLSGGFSWARNGNTIIEYDIQADGLYLTPFGSSNSVDLTYAANSSWLPSVNIIATI